MSDTKKFNEWEKIKGIIIKDATAEDLKSSLTEDEFIERWTGDLDNAHGVNWSGREEFLKENGYDITRENMVEDLPNTTTPEPDLGLALVEELKGMQEPIPAAETKELAPPPEA